MPFQLPNPSAVLNTVVSGWACRKPWEHVAFGFAGAYAANWLVEMEDKMIKQIEDSYEKYSQPQAQ